MGVCRAGVRQRSIHCDGRCVRAYTLPPQHLRLAKQLDKPVRLGGKGPRMAFQYKFTAVILALGCVSASVKGQSWPAISFGKPIAGFKHPTHLASAHDGSNRLFVVEQAGRIRIVNNGAILSTPFLDITARVGITSGTKGLLSVAFPPDFANKQHFYVNYTTAAGYIVIARYLVGSNPDLADTNSEQVVLIDGPFPDHYGGELSFGPLDGYLYFGIGTGSGSSPDSLGQDLSVLRGKLLRIDVETRSPATYTIPPSNPYLGSANTRTEIWANGVRNPWRSSFNRQTGDYFIADVGQSAREEIDFQPAGSAGGENYGWNIMEGSLCFGATSCDTTGLTLPVAEYDHTQGCAVSGGTVYLGDRYPGLHGIYFFGDWCSGQLSGLRYANAAWQTAVLYDTTFSIISFTEDEVGKLWVADYTGGGVYPIEEGASVPADISLMQSDAPDPCSAGNLLTYTIDVRNNGSRFATGLVITDTMPNGVSFVSASSTAGTCTRSGSTVTCRIPSLAAFSVATITLRVKPLSAGTISNAASVIANEPDPDLTNNSSTETTTITPAADLKVTVTDNKTSIAAGAQNTYTIVVSNAGPSPATGATVTDVFPGIFINVTYTATQVGGATGFNASGSGNINDTVNLPSGGKITYTAKGKVSTAASGTLSNTAKVSKPADLPDPNAANNSATDSDSIIFKADLKATVTDGKTAAIAGTTNTYTITVTNLGPSNVSGALISDNFPTSFTNATYTATQTGGATGFTSSGSGNINDTVNMPAAAKIIYKATGKINASATGSISDTAVVTCPNNISDPNTVNNNATDTDTL
jgi:uncharacterized repeat protein (TIGR01451 family)